MTEQDAASSFEPGFAGIVEAAPVGVLLINQAGSIAYVNAALENMFGYDRTQLLGESVEMLLPESLRDAHVQFRKQFFRAPAARTMGSGRELFAQHSSGEKFPIEIGLGLLGTGVKAQAVAFVIDISSRKAVERKLLSVIDSLPVGVLVANDSCEIELANPYLLRMFGYEMQELRGQKIEMLLPDRLRASHPSLRNAYMHAPTVRTMGEGRDLLARHRLGHEFPVEVALSPLEKQSGHSVLAVISDISLRKSLEEQLKLANANLEEFTYAASHDLRSPLRGIADLLSWIKEEIAADQLTESMVNNFERAETRIHKAERMIDDLLVYARAGSKDTEVGEFDLAEVVNEAIALVHNPHGLTIENLIVPRTLRSARVPLFAAIRNIIDNAVKHHDKEQGLIQISLREDQHYYVISIEDDGPGIPAPVRERVFKLFHRASSRTEGHGIGLAVTRRMVQANGGGIQLVAPTHLTGACFEIRWPRFQLKEDFNEH